MHLLDTFGTMLSRLYFVLHTTPSHVLAYAVMLTALAIAALICVGVIIGMRHTASRYTRAHYLPRRRVY